MNRRNTGNDEAMCVICDLWWLWLLIFVAIVAAILTRDYWLPAPQTGTPTPALATTPINTPPTSATATQATLTTSTPPPATATTVPGTAISPLRVGSQAPDFTLPRLGGGEISLSAQQGKPVVLMFFASFDSYSQAQAPTIRKLSQKYGDELVILPVNIAYNDLTADVNKFVSDQKWEFPIALDETGAIQTLYEQNSIPAYIFIDKAGKIFAMDGVLTSDQLEQKTSELMK